MQVNSLRFALTLSAYHKTRLIQVNLKAGYVCRSKPELISNDMIEKIVSAFHGRTFRWNLAQDVNEVEMK